MGVYDEDFHMYQVESANSLNQEREAELSAAYRESMKSSGMSGTVSARADDYDMAALADSDLPDDILSPRFSNNLLIGTHDAKTGVNLLGREAIEPDVEPTIWSRVRDHLDAEMDFLKEDVFEFGMESGLQVAGMYEDVRNNVLNVTADIAAAMGAPEEQLVRGESVVPDPQNPALAVGRGLGAYAAQYVTSRAALIKSIGQPATLMGKFGIESAAGAVADFMSDPRTDSLVDFVSSIFNQERVVAETYRNNPILARTMLAGEGLAIGGVVEGVAQIPAAVRRLGAYADDLEQIGVDRIRRSSHKLHTGIDPEGLRGIVEYMTAKILKGENSLTDGMREELVHTGATGQQLEEAWEQALRVADTAEERYITVWHGSPHKYDQPSLQAVGTGEGAQAFGYGYYSAESPGVAKFYMPSDFEYKEELLNQHSWMAVDVYERAMLNESPSEMRAYFNDPENQFSKVDIAEANQAIDYFEERLKNQTASFYKLRIPKSDVDNYLDWDKPLSEQPEAVQRLFRRGYTGQFEPEYEDLTGKQIYVKGQSKFGGAKKYSDFLLSEGVPGIRYLDGISRAKGQGTSNFVTFDPSRIQVISRNGKELRKNEKKRAEVLAALGSAGAVMQVYDDSETVQ